MEAGEKGSVIVTHSVWNDSCLCAWKPTEPFIIWGNRVESGDDRVDKNPQYRALRGESYAEAGACRGSSQLSVLSLKEGWIT